MKVNFKCALSHWQTSSGAAIGLSGSGDRDVADDKRVEYFRSWCQVTSVLFLRGFVRLIHSVNSINGGQGGGG